MWGVSRSTFRAKKERLCGAPETVNTPLLTCRLVKVSSYIQPVHISERDMAADPLTKYLTHGVWARHMSSYALPA